MNIELTTQEASNLLQLIDLAVKANGLNVAQAALTLSTKINEAAEKEVPTKKVK